METLEKKGYISKVSDFIGTVKVTKRYTLNITRNLEEKFSKNNMENENFKNGDNIANSIKKEVIKSAQIPLLGKLKNRENILSEENIIEYISVPEEYGKEKQIYSFRIAHSKYKELGIFRDSIVVFDVKQHYIPGDFVAFYEKQKNRINIQKYIRGEDKSKNLGKVIGCYTKITF